MSIETDLTIAIHEPRWHEAFPELREHAQRIIRDVLLHCSARLDEQLGELMRDDAPLEVAIVFTHAQEIQLLNRRFRSKDAPTNVLSFPADLEALTPEGQPTVLGDLIMAYQVIEREAEEQAKTIKDHTTHMLVHGMLHLLGYDHICNDEAEEMEALEREILQHYGIPDPYQLQLGSPHSSTTGANA